MNAATVNAVDQLKAAREALYRALDDPSLTNEQHQTLVKALDRTHGCVLHIGLAFR